MFLQYKFIVRTINLLHRRKTFIVLTIYLYCKKRESYRDINNLLL